MVVKQENDSANLLKSCTYEFRMFIDDIHSACMGNRRRCNTKIHAFRMSETYLNRRKVLKEMTSVGQWRRITTAISLRRFVPGHGGHPALLHLRGNGSKGLPSVRPEVPLLHPQKFVRHQTRHTTTALQACDLRVIGNKSNLPRRRAARRNPVW